MDRTALAYFSKRLSVTVEPKLLVQRVSFFGHFSKGKLELGVGQMKETRERRSLYAGAQPRTPFALDEPRANDLLQGNAEKLADFGGRVFEADAGPDATVKQVRSRESAWSAWLDG